MHISAHISLLASILSLLQAWLSKTITISSHPNYYTHQFVLMPL